MNIQCFEIWLQDDSDTCTWGTQVHSVSLDVLADIFTLAKTVVQREQGLYGDIPWDLMSTLSAFQESLLWTNSYVAVRTAIVFLRAEQ